MRSPLEEEESVEASFVIQCQVIVIGFGDSVSGH
jgi:hypothetical protein